MIKPDAVESGYIGPILDKITSSGFKIIAMKFTQLSSREAEKFYDIHKTKPFFGELIKFMTRGPIVAMVLEKDNAVDNFRPLIGSTNPEQAEEGTIRKLHALNIQENSVHGSDSSENAEIEIKYFFYEIDIIY